MRYASPRYGLFLPTALWVSRLFGDTQAEAVREATSRERLVVFDDLGQEYDKPGTDVSYTKGIINAVLAEREAQEAPTIITSNLTLDQFAARYGSHLLDRLKGSWGRVVEYTGPSHR